MDQNTVSIIIPVFNEGGVLKDILRKIFEQYPYAEIIVINDGSTDDTAKIARDAGVIVYSHPYNIGNGAAIKSGIRIASGEILVFMDGDGQHDPDDIDLMLDCFPDFDMVVGARPVNGHASLSRRFGNWALNRLASYVAKFKVQDLTSGFRAVKAEIAHEFIHLLPNTYSYPTTLTLAVLRDGRCMKYLPIQPNERKAGKSKIKVMRDGVKFFMIITKICTLFSPLRIFLPVSFFLFLVGLGYYLYTFFASGRFTNMSALLFSTSVIILMMGLISEQVSQLRFDRSKDRFS